MPRPPERGWLVTLDPHRARVLHVTPVGDVVAHQLTDECVCGPEAILEQSPSGDAWILRHHSLDGRELLEPDHEPRA